MYTIEDVARYFGLVRTRRGHAPAGTFNVVCPFCGDERGKCNMVIRKGNKENVYHCYNCDAAGSMYDLYASLEGISAQNGYSATKIAAKKMRNVLGNGAHSFSFSVINTPVHQENKASVEAMDTVYQALLSFLSLKEEHKADLKKRGLSEEQIVIYGFRSTPDPKEAATITRRILQKGLSVRGVPGFYKSKTGDWTLNIHDKNAGYLCPVYDLKRRITGFQIRNDDVTGPKYLWLTSAGKWEGVSSGSPATFLGEANAEDVIITEGILKATVIHALSGRSVIGIPGVDNMASIPSLFRELTNLKRVYEAMDMDKYMPVECDGNEKSCDNCDGPDICPSKVDKREKIRKACNKLLGISKDYERILMRWDYSLIGEKTIWNGNVKGLDDWLLYEKRKENAL